MELNLEWLVGILISTVLLGFPIMFWFIDKRYKDRIQRHTVTDEIKQYMKEYIDSKIALINNTIEDLERDMRRIQIRSDENEIKDYKDYRFYREGRQRNGAV